jgi:hypothetical protein
MQIALQNGRNDVDKLPTSTLCALGRGAVCEHPIYRWLYFLKERRHLDNYLFAVETFPDGQTAGVYSGYINNLPEASAAACIDCAAKET